MFVSRKKYRAALDALSVLQDRLANEVELGLQTAVLAGQNAKILRTLRANCFITNEKGHRVRYINASPERQAKAEGRS